MATTTGRTAPAPWLGLSGWTLFIVMFVFQWWTVASSGVDLRPAAERSDYYNLLASGFLKGRLSLPVDPDPGLLALADPYDPELNARFRIPGATHDLSLFQGHYYIYFGVVPVTVLFLPFRAITGLALPIEIGLLLFASLGVLFLTSGIGRLWRLGGLPQKAGVGAAVLVVIGWGSELPFILRRPAIYETAVAAGFCFIAGSLLAAVVAIETGSQRALAGSSLLTALAVGCRPIHIVGLLIPGIAALVIARKEPAPERMRRALAFAIPASIVLALLLAYNYARFGNVLEFGQNYFLYDYRRGENLPGLRFVPVNLWIQLFSPPSIGPEFPFFRLQPAWIPPLPAGHLVVDPVAGIVACAPIAFFAFMPFLARPAGLIRFAASALLVIGLITAGVVATFPAVAARYSLDSGSYFLAGGILVAGSLWSATRSRLLAAGLGLALLYQAAMNTLVSFTGNSDWLKDRNRDTFARLESAFSPVQRVWFAVARGRYGPVRFDVRFPSGEGREPETLLAAGGAYRHNALCVVYRGARRLSLRFHQRGGNAPLETGVIRIEPRSLHTVEVEMGSLYPVSRNTLERLFPGRGLFDRAEQLIVRFDGEEVLRNRYDFVPSVPERVTIGRETVDPQYCPAPFSGDISRVTRSFP